MALKVGTFDTIRPNTSEGQVMITGSITGTASTASFVDLQAGQNINIDRSGSQFEISVSTEIPQVPYTLFAVLVGRQVENGPISTEILCNTTGYEILVDRVEDTSYITLTCAEPIFKEYKTVTTAPKLRSNVEVVAGFEYPNFDQFEWQSEYNINFYGPATGIPGGSSIIEPFYKGVIEVKIYN